MWMADRQRFRASGGDISGPKIPGPVHLWSDKYPRRRLEICFTNGGIK